MQLPDTHFSQTVIVHEGTGWFIPWQTVADLCKDIQVQMKAANYTPSNILCLGRGGMIAARLLAGDGLPIYFYGVSSYTVTNEQAETAVLQDLTPEQWLELNNPSTLIVDDLWDTGATLNDVYEKIPTANAALLLSKKKPEETSASFVGINIVTDEWIVFPWERPL